MPQAFRASRRRWLLACAAAPLAAALPGCAQAEPLNVACHVWPGYELMFLARSLGWLTSDSVRLIETTSATRSMAALADGRVDAAALTLDEMLLLRSQGIALEAVLVFNTSAGADAVISRPDIRDPAQLRGKRIGAETTALGALMLDRLLARGGLTRQDVIVESLTPDAHLTIWRTGTLDAVVTYEPQVSHLLQLGAHRLLDSRQLPESIFDVLAVRSSVASGYGRALRALIAAHFRALDHLRHNPQDAAYRMATRLTLPGEAALQAFRGLHLPGIVQNRHLLAPDGRLQSVAGELSALMLNSGLLPAADSLTGLCTDAYLPEGVRT